MSNGTEADDVLASSLELNLSVSEAKSHTRPILFKPEGKESYQQKRRDDFLNAQKEKRRDLTKHARSLALQAPPEQNSQPNEVDMVPEQKEQQQQQQTQAMEVQTKPKRKKAKESFREQLMMPEPMSEIPSDLTSEWFVVACPVGRRCLVISSRHITVSRLANGTVLNKFSSSLPGGSSHGRGVDSYCILDCIYYEPTLTYFVLDIMCWKGYSLYDCASDFRFYWKITKLQETEANVSSEQNPYRFISLPFYESTLDGLVTLKNSTTEYPKETLVFYNKQTHYTFGNTPLVYYLDSKFGEQLIDALKNSNSMV